MLLGSKEDVMNIKNLIKGVVVKEATKSVIGQTIPAVSKKGISKGKMTLGALVLAIAGLLFEYLS
jgi:hypothetical protein